MVLQRLTPYLFIIVIAYSLSELILLSMRTSLFPTLPAKRAKKVSLTQKTDIDYEQIINSNILSYKNIIPPSLSQTQVTSDALDDSTRPRKSSLRIKLLGTIVHSVSNYSVATVLLPGKKEANAYSVSEKIGNLAKLIKIQRDQIIFRNLKNNKIEYVDLPKIGSSLFSTKPSFSEPSFKLGITKTDNRFSISRTMINKHLEPDKLGSLLRTAKVIPNKEGFRFIQINPNSVFSNLGFKPNDTLVKVNGISPLGKNPWELFNQFKTQSNLNIEIIRNGKKQTILYTIK